MRLYSILDSPSARWGLRPQAPNLNHDGEFCFGRPPSLLPSQSRRGVLFRQTP
ncbi:hypothetical protein J6590_082437 [Homalodisca vitripennis]|nr:hypothetical protein J6590_082437 [Homalodisca vitripennis]